RVAEHDADSPRRRQEKAPREAVLEVARDAEAGEHTAERSRLEQDEDELERRVPGWVVEARYVLELREAARERGEEEEREDQRRQQERRRREDVLERPEGDTARNGPDPHRASLALSAQAASTSDTTAMIAATPKPSASASPFQPRMMRLRTHSIRYETG